MELLLKTLSEKHPGHTFESITIVDGDEKQVKQQLVIDGENAHVKWSAETDLSNYDP
jgi:hypothetical protein